MRKFILSFIVLTMCVAFLAAVEREEVPVPPYQFEVNPTDVGTTFYDYQPGSYCSIPIRWQPEEVGGGMYMVYHTQPTADGMRRVSYVHVGADGTITGPNFMTTSETIRKGYPGMDIDPVTGNPLWAFHANLGGGTAYEVGFGYDNFGAFGAPGFAVGPWVGIDNEAIQADPLEYLTYDYNEAGVGADEFIWPYTYVGESPLGEGKRRAYIVAKNYVSGAAGTPQENVLFAYADFDTAALNGTDNLDWTYTSIPFFDDMHINETQERPFQSVAVGENGRVAFFGYRVGDVFEGQSMLDVDDSYVVYSEDYGETWEVEEVNLTMPPSVVLTMEDGSPYIEDYIEGSMAVDYGATGHFNPVFDVDNNLQVPMVWNVSYQTPENAEDEFYVFPYNQMIKNVKFDFNTKEFTLVDIYPTANNGENGLPWDVDADGIIDEFSEEGYPIRVPNWPVYYWDRDVASLEFQESNIKVTRSYDDKVIAAVWQDSWKANEYNANGDEEYADYASAPEICISFSEDNGNTWYNPVMLNSVDTPELQGIIPEYVYPADQIKKVGLDEYELTLMWLNDSSYGSSITDSSFPTASGTIQFATIKFELSDNQVEATPKTVFTRSYPNPYTVDDADRGPVVIEFTKPSTGSAKVSVFNVKGQKITTLSNVSEVKGKMQVTWDSASDATSGVYFYKVETNDYTKVDKMIIVK